MLERFLDQIGEVLRLCEDTDGILVVNREGIIEYHRIPLNSYWCSQDTQAGKFPPSVDKSRSE